MISTLLAAIIEIDENYIHSDIRNKGFEVKVADADITLTYTYYTAFQFVHPCARRLGGFTSEWPPLGRRRFEFSCALSPREERKPPICKARTGLFFLFVLTA